MEYFWITVNIMDIIDVTCDYLNNVGDSLKAWT